MNKKIISAIFFMMLFTLFSESKAYDNEITHKDITKTAVISKKCGLDNYLKANLELSDGYETMIKGKKIIDWLMDGSENEDTPKCRATNHFHDPLIEEWSLSGLSYKGFISDYCLVKGWPCEKRKSAVTWATGYASPSPDGYKVVLTYEPNLPINWDNARQYFYNALTLSSYTERESSLASAFEALGHVLHLLQDMAVPAHTRDDFSPGHLFYVGAESFEKLFELSSFWINPFEFYVKKHPAIVTLEEPEMPDFSGSGVRLTDFWDRKMYNGDNPSVNKTWGLAEISNAGYFSDGSIPGNNPSPHRLYNHPTLDDGYEICETEFEVPVYKPVTDSGNEPPPKICKRKYVSLKGCLPLAAESLLTNLSYTNIGLALILDEHVHKTYAEKLIPLAVGYSAKLTDYFFRGDCNIVPDENADSGLVIENLSSDDMDGTFGLYYDKTNNERVKLWEKTLAVAAGGKSDNIGEIPATEYAKEPGKYILVFRGKLGEEDDAVAGSVFSCGVLEISPPDRFLYSVTDGSLTKQQFTRITAKVRNTLPEKAVQTGTLRAVAKYKKRVGYQPDLSADPPTAESREEDFSYSVSAPAEITSLDSGTAEEFVFDFSETPVPAGITDLYLYAIFRGKVGDETDGIASGFRDLNEPHHICVWNLTDRVYLDGVPRTAQEITETPALFERLDQDGDGILDFIIDPLNIDCFVEYYDPAESPSGVLHAAWYSLAPGRYGRIIILSDSPVIGSFFYAVSGSFASIPGVVNQEDGDGVFSSRYIRTLRGIKSHSGQVYITAFPDYQNFVNAQWPAAVSPYPVPASEIFP